MDLLGKFTLILQCLFKNKLYNYLVNNSALQRTEGSGQFKSNSVRFCNNNISNLENLSSTLEQLLENPLELAWLDLSFNDISTIDKVSLHCGYQD